MKNTVHLHYVTSLLMLYRKIIFIVIIRNNTSCGSVYLVLRCLTFKEDHDQFWFQLMHHNFTLLTKSLTTEDKSYSYISFIYLISDEVEPVAVYV